MYIDKASDFVKLIGVINGVEFSVNTFNGVQQWMVGTVVGIDIERNYIKVMDDMGHSHWNQIYFQLTPHMDKTYRVRIKV